MNATQTAPSCRPDVRLWLLEYAKGRPAVLTFELGSAPGSPLPAGEYRAERTAFEYAGHTVWTVWLLRAPTGTAYRRAVGRVFLGPTPFGEPFTPGGGFFAAPTPAHEARQAVLQIVAETLHARLQRESAPPHPPRESFGPFVRRSREVPMFHLSAKSDPNLTLALNNDQFECLAQHGVFLPAGLWFAGDRIYSREDQRWPAGEGVVSARDAVGVLRAWQTYRDAVLAAPTGRPWVTPLDRQIVRQRDAIGAFFARSGGFTFR